MLARQFQGDVGALLADLVAQGRSTSPASRARSSGVLAFLVPPAFVGDGAPLPALRAAVRHRDRRHLPVRRLVRQRGHRALLPGPALFAWSWLAIAAGAGIELVFSAARGDPADDEAFDLPPAPRRLSLRASVALAVAVALLVPTGVALSTRWRAVDRSNDTTMADWLDDAMTRPRARRRGRLVVVVLDDRSGTASSSRAGARTS